MKVILITIGLALTCAKFGEDPAYGKVHQKIESPTDGTIQFHLCGDYTYSLLFILAPSYYPVCLYHVILTSVLRCAIVFQ